MRTNRLRMVDEPPKAAAPRQFSGNSRELTGKFDALES